MSRVPTSPGKNPFAHLMVSSPGKFPANTATHSHFNNPLDTSRPFSGNSRRWGDANAKTQRKVVDELLFHAKESKLSCNQTAILLATARFESGFNPDAAAGSSSAAGIGQFVNKTGAAYGLKDENRFSISDNAKALVLHLKDNLHLIRRRFGTTSPTETAVLAYALHHDGPSLKYGGMQLAREQLLPWYQRFRKAINPIC